MMKAMMMGVFLLTASCGSSPSGDCDQLVSVTCNKLFQCSATLAAQTYGNESACETKLQATDNCATAACPAGQSYDGTPIESCINALNNLSCANITQEPSQCQNIGLTAVCH